MKKFLCTSCGILFGSFLFAQTIQKNNWDYNQSKGVMEEEYWSFWNDDVQAKIDRDIEQHRKANAVLKLDDISVGTEVHIKQTGHNYFFGGNIFLFKHFDTPEQNQIYENTFGDLFNAATIPFYWKTLEPERGSLRFEEGSSYSYRRPPTDPVVDFCESKGINMNGHAIIYGMRRWGHPEWMPDNRDSMEHIFDQHVKTLADRYKDRIDRWDVVNESINQADRGLMPDDYTYKVFSAADKYFPKNVLFNTNDCDIHWGPTPRYIEIVRNLVDRGARVDYVGVQMHIFNPEESTRISKGENILTPEKNYAVLESLNDTNRPVHISEVTVSAPDESDRGQLIQAIIARNLYRLWFSYPSSMGITWWNVVDGGAAAGEPSLSGLYEKDLTPKIAYHALDDLINNEWKTNKVIKSVENGKIQFRGFKGTYQATWRDSADKLHEASFTLTDDGIINFKQKSLYYEN